MATDIERVRALIGERIGTGETEADTMFTDAQIQDLLTDADGDVNVAAWEAWKVKSAEYVDLVDTAEGTSKRALSDAHDHALKMVDSFSPGGDSGNVVPTRIHKIVRS